MLPQLVVSVVQSRILLTLLFNGSLLSSVVTKRCRISGSTWKKESASLLRAGLIGFSDRKIMADRRVIRVKYCFLTQKGSELARRIQGLSEFMGESMVVTAS